MSFERNLIIITMFVMLSLPVNATTAYIKPPYLIYTFNVTEGQTNTFPGSVEVKNLNNFPVTVVFSKPSWIQMISSAQLQPNEAKQVSFNIVLTQGGNYNGDISAAYSAPNKFTASASSSITVNANSGTSQSTTSTTTSTTTTLPPTTTSSSSATTTTTSSTTTTTSQPDNNEQINEVITSTTIQPTTSTTFQTDTAENPITINIVRGPSTSEIGAIIAVIVGTVITAVFVLRR